MPSAPVRYAPDVKTLRNDKAELVSGLNGAFYEILTITAEDSSAFPVELDRRPARKPGAVASTSAAG